MRLNLVLLGGFEVFAGGDRPRAMSLRKGEALLAYLALHPDRRHRRERLAGFLWGEATDENARNALRQTLFVLNRDLGGTLSECLEADGSTLVLRGETVATDVRRFESLVARGVPDALEHAAAMYRGDLLDGFDVGTDGFGAWLDQERQRLRNSALGALEGLLDHYTACGPADAAIKAARHLLAFDPVEEAVHRQLMRLLVEVGRPEAALLQFRLCAAALQRELDLGPAAETLRLYESISRDRSRAGAPSQPPGTVETAPSGATRAGGSPSVDLPGVAPPAAPRTVAPALDPTSPERRKSDELRRRARAGRARVRAGLAQQERRVFAFSALMLENLRIRSALRLERAAPGSATSPQVRRGPA